MYQQSLELVNLGGVVSTYCIDGVVEVAHRLQSAYVCSRGYMLYIHHRPGSRGVPEGPDAESRGDRNVVLRAQYVDR